MQINAAVLWEQGQPLSVETAELDAPGPGEVLVEVKAAGVCHSDLHPARDDWPTKTPVVLGHEGAGIVREVGAGVTSVKPGDHVVLCWAPACGVCLPAARATRCCAIGSRRPRIATSCRRRDAAARARPGRRAVSRHGLLRRSRRRRRRRRDSGRRRRCPFAALATLGCAVVTGVGAVTNAAQVPAGRDVAVIGAGGVGLNVVQGAVIAGCERIIAIDRRPEPLDDRRQFGATDTLEAPADVADGRARADRRPRRRLRVRHRRQPGDAGRCAGRRARAARSSSPACRAWTPWRRSRCFRSSCRRSA